MTDIKRIARMLALSGILVALTACTASPQTGDDVVEGGIPLRFETGPSGTRAAAFPRGSTMGVTAIHHSPSGTASYLMHGQKAVLGAAGWEYSPEKYWKADGVTDFYAWSPFDSQAIAAALADGGPENGSLSVICPPDASEDLLIARPLTGLTAEDSPVTFAFAHVFSRLSLRCTAPSQAPDGSRVTVKTVSITSAPEGGTFNVSSGEWQEVSSTLKDYAQTVGVTLAKDALVIDFHLIPFTAGPNCRLVVEWDRTQGEDTVESGRYVRPLGGTDFLQGRSLTFNISKINGQ